MHWNSPANQKRLKRLFEEGFTAMDIAEPLASFDAEQSAISAQVYLEQKGFDFVGVRREGMVRGYACKSELGPGMLGEYQHFFIPGDLVLETDNFQTVIQTMAEQKRCFVKVLGEVGAIITLHDLEKPPVRMFIFGMITIFEMMMSWAIRMYFPGESLQKHISPGRLAKAESLLQERRRRHSPADLLDCLQFSDRAQLLLRIPRAMEVLSQSGIPSKQAALKAIGELETLRNNIAHSQEIIPESWKRIVIFSSRLELLLGETIKR
ncbi:MAG: hypothetical protein JW902_17540 [Syntrophaceae bacterium]|nr:hypothetical protein [Syntrophaceae bacterium]